jgi:hypothetical protein
MREALGRCDSDHLEIGVSRTATMSFSGRSPIRMPSSMTMSSAHGQSSVEADGLFTAAIAADDLEKSTN